MCGFTCRYDLGEILSEKLAGRCCRREKERLVKDQTNDVLTPAPQKVYSGYICWNYSREIYKSLNFALAKLI